MRVTLSSRAFASGGSIPSRYTCDGAGTSPPLEWTGGPSPGAYILVVDDPDAPNGDFVHWTVFGPVSSRRFPEGAAPPEATQGVNSLGHARWDPPCPPRGDPPHRYRFTIYVAGVLGSPGPDAPIRRILDIARRFSTGSAQLFGTYARR